MTDFEQHGKKQKNSRNTLDNRSMVVVDDGGMKKVSTCDGEK